MFQFQVAFGMMSSSMFYYNQAIFNLFLDAEVEEKGPSFTTMTSIEDLWKVTTIIVVVVIIVINNLDTG